MSIFDDWGDALSGPVDRTFSGFEQVFTNPTKANLGDALSVVFPFVGGTIAYDVKNPTAIPYQAATLAAAAGGAELLSVYGPSYFASPADKAIAAKAAAANADALAMFNVPASVPSPAALIASDFGPVAASSPVSLAGVSGKAAAANAAATNATASGAAAAKAAAPSAVKSAIGGFLQNVKDAGPIAATLALLQGGKPKTGAGVNGGSNPPVGVQGVPVPVPVGQGAQQASLAGGSKLPLLLMLGALLGVGAWLWKRRKQPGS